MPNDLKSLLNHLGLPPAMPRDLDEDERYAIDQLAGEEPEVGEALEVWAEMSIRGRHPRVDETLLDRLEALMLRARDSAPEKETAELDEHECNPGSDATPAPRSA